MSKLTSFIIWFGVMFAVVVGLGKAKEWATYRHPRRQVATAGAAGVGTAATSLALPSLPWQVRGFGVLLAAVFVYQVLVSIANGKAARLMRLPAVAPSASARATVSTTDRATATAVRPFAPVLVDAASVTVGSGNIQPPNAHVRVTGLAGLVQLFGTLRRLWRQRRRRPVLVRTMLLWVFADQANSGTLAAATAYGPAYQLRGGGLVSEGHVTEVLSGRVAETIEQTEQEVDARVASFANDVHGFGFARHTMLCSDDTWTYGLNRLMTLSDVVLMDLSEYTSERGGCEYEMRTLVERYPAGRVVMIVGPHTDDDRLMTVLAQSWSAMSTDSPNRTPQAGQITLARTTSLSAPADPQSSESLQHRKEIGGLTRLLLQATGGAALVAKADVLDGASIAAVAGR